MSMQYLDNVKKYIKKRFLGKTLNQKFHMLFGMNLSLYIILFFVFFIFVFRGNVEKHIEQVNYDTMVSMGNDLNTSFENISTMGKIIITNEDIRTYLRSKDDSENVFNVLSSIQSVTTAFNNIDSIFIFKLDGQYLDIINVNTEVDLSIINNAEWKERVFSQAGRNVVLINGAGLFPVGQEKNIVSFARVINDINTQKPIGVLVINASVDILENTYNAMNDKGNDFAFYDENGRLLCGSTRCEFANDFKKDEVFMSRNKGNGWREYYYSINGAPLILVENTRIDYIKQLPLQSIALVALVVALTLFCFAIISFFIKREITMPIQGMVSSMDNVKSGWLRRVGMKLPNDEMGKLKDSYNNMLIEINRLIKELLKKEKHLHIVELEAMQEQIKPHFLYNTLDMIGSLALDANAEDAYDAIEALGVFYRNFLSKGEQEIPISDEIEITKSYLKLQRLRYGEIFDEKIVVEEGLEKRKILKLILQPLVENALYHGAIPKGEKCIINISIKKLGEDIEVNVTDTGVGMDKDQIEKILGTDSKSFGLKRTLERIQNFYGSEVEYQLFSKPGYYFQVHIRIPQFSENSITDK